MKSFSLSLVASASFAVAGGPGRTGQLGSEESYYWGGIAGTAFFVGQEEERIGLFMTQHWLDLEPDERFKVLAYQAIVN